MPINGPKWREEFKNLVKNHIPFLTKHMEFNSMLKLKNLIYNDKSKIVRNSFAGVYQQDWMCNALHIFVTKKKVLYKTIENQQRSFNKNLRRGATMASLSIVTRAEIFFFSWIWFNLINAISKNSKSESRWNLKKLKINKKRKLLNFDKTLCQICKRFF